jgi:hypothetical protein
MLIRAGVAGGTRLRPRMPDTELEDMLVRMFAPRAIITTKPDDPERDKAILEEWSVIISLIRQGGGHLFDLPPVVPICCVPARGHRVAAPVAVQKSRFSQQHTT